LSGQDVKPEKAAQCGGQILQRNRLVTASLTSDVLENRFPLKLAQCQIAAPFFPLGEQKLSDLASPMAAGGLSQASNIEKMSQI
jgi:hypothetical protein